MRVVRAAFCLALAAALPCCGCGSGRAGEPQGATSRIPRASATVPTSPVLSPSSSGTTLTTGPTPRPASSAGSAPGETSATAAAASSCVDSTLARLSPSQRAAQVLLVGVSAADPTADSPRLVVLGVGGIFLRGRVAGGSSLRGALSLIQRTAGRQGTLPLLVSADEEGGAVQTVTGGTIPPFPSALTQGGWSSSTLRTTTARWATALRSLGVNLDLAPVADTVPASLGTGNPPIGRYRREYGTTPGVVSRALGLVVPAMTRAHLGATLKHFPGLGRVRANTDTSAQAVDGTTTAVDPSLQPFTAGLRAGATAVMVSSALYPALDAHNPAMWSRPVVTDLLRGRLGWGGLVVSDDLGQAVAAQTKPVGGRAVAFLGAGGDLVLTVRPDQAAPMRNAIAAQARRASWRKRLDDAVRHVLAAKFALGLVRC